MNPRVPTDSRLAILVAILALAAVDRAVAQTPAIAQVIEVSKVWSGHPVGFCLLTHGSRQYVAYYDANRRMTVAMRNLHASEWVYQGLEQEVNWDSHNYITMAVDKRGHLHVSGNMHGAPLVYFRTSEPYDVRTLQRVGSMVGSQENRCTYPQFPINADGELMFLYRDGQSGNGVQLVNAYDAKTQIWRRLLSGPLFDGLGQMSCYPEGPVLGPDGSLHLAWVWRDSGACETNHDLCYARSKDMVHWESATGLPITLPITPKSKQTIVDPVPARGGMINDSTVIGFDARRRPIIGYHKFDQDGYTQIYNARFEEGQWHFYQTSDWKHRWYFSGGGTIDNDVDLGPVMVSGQGVLIQGYKHIQYGDGVWKLDERTLKPVASMQRGPALLGTASKPESSVAGMEVRWKEDDGRRGPSGARYFLRWETLPSHRDQPREQAPAPTILRLYQLENAELFDLRLSCIHDGYF